MVIDILNDTLHDTILMLPLLYVTYLLIEWFTRKNHNDKKLFTSLQTFGPVLGALVGMLPQCGFSVIAVMLFVNRNITIGTLISVFIATSDEAIPILLANPSLYSSMLSIIAIKVILAIVVGYLVDLVVKGKKPVRSYDENQEITRSCTCSYRQYAFYISAFIRAIKVFLFVFITTLALNAFIAMIGEDSISHLLLKQSILQPIIAAIFGFIPNCAASVVLTQLYVAGTVSFASLLAGLITNAGLGLLMLIRYQAKKRDILIIIGVLLFCAIGIGMILEGLL